MIKWEFIGRLHPLILHLPIGLIFGLLLIEGLALVVDTKARAWKVCRKAYITLLALSSLAAAVTGYILSLEGQRSGAILMRHKWFGIGVVGVSLVVLILTTTRSDLPKGRVRAFYRWLAILGLLATITVTGHLGGQLTHGPRFLATHAPPMLQAYLGPPPQEELAPTLTESVTGYHILIQPILEKHCAFCHGPDRKMGQLAVHSYETLKAGGSSGPVISPDMPQNSELIKRIVSPLDDPGHMPPEGKSQLSATQISALQWWIKKGASNETKLDKEKLPRELLELLPQTVSASEQPAPSQAPTEWDEAVIRRLMDQQISIQRIQQDSQQLWISFPAISDQVTDETVEQLLPLSPFIAWLDLSNTKISAKAMQWIAEMPALEELNLRQTPIQAQDLVPLAQHKRIERLNLSGVSLDDTIVDLLGKMPNLKRVYLGGSQVSKAGIRRLSAPRIEVITEAKPSEVVPTDPKGPVEPSGL